MLRALIAGLMISAVLAWVHIFRSVSWLAILAGTAVAWSAVELTLRRYTDLFEPGPGEWKIVHRLRPFSAGLQFALLLAIVLFSCAKMAAPLGATVLVLLILLWLANLFPLSGGARRTYRRRRALTVLVAVVALNIVAIAYLATPPVDYDRAEVQMSTGKSVVGAYLGRDSDGIHLAVCRAVSGHPDQSEKPRIRVIPEKQIEGLRVGGVLYSFNFGRRPTLITLVEHAFSDEDLSPNSDGVSLDLREERHACGT